MENKDVDGDIISRCTRNKLVGKAWTGLVWFRIWTFFGVL
jgi:hypothetical protein